jgi:ssRNA-specific RNase YbeY (16S rRNA maturation enzyme)
LEYITQNAENISMETVRMIIHGLLHIVGYDHTTYFYEDNHEEEMYTIQEKYLSQIFKVMKM